MAAKSHIRIRRRLMVVFLSVCILAAGLCCRLVYLQVYQSGWLSENAVDQRVRSIPVEPRRGTIYDRGGNELAVSSSIASIYAIPAEIKNTQQTAANLAAILNSDEDRLAKKLSRRQAFTWIARKVTAEQAQAARALDMPGIGLTEEGDRSYPQGTLAAHVLGFVGLDSQGLDGVELTLDRYLKGTRGSVVVEYDGGGREIPAAAHRYIAPQQGNAIYLTLDLVIQKIVEREVETAMENTGAKAVSVIAMQPDTGEVLALANRPNYDPNHFADYAPKAWRNIALSNAFEPGSTFKILTAAAALDSHTVRKNDHFFDSGAINVQGRTIHCWRHGGHGSQTFQQVVENSCNPGFVSVGLQLGAERFYEYLTKFGLGALTDAELPGEAKGIMIAKAKAQPINIGTMAMGQSIAVTPLQLVTAVSAAVNGGVLMKPLIVKSVQNPQGETIAAFEKEERRRVISEENSAQLRAILESVVKNGTGKNAYIEGLRIGGKTGTAQKAGKGGYEPGKYLASFIGFAPANHPKIVIVVAIDEPAGMYYGGQVAAPVFKNIMRDVAQYLQI